MGCGSSRPPPLSQAAVGTPPALKIREGDFPTFPSQGLPPVGQESDVPSNVQVFGQHLFQRRAGGLTFSRRRLQGPPAPRGRVGGPSVCSTDIQGPQPAEVGTQGPRFVPAGPKQRSAMARSWCRSPGRQAARQRSSKRSRARGPVPWAPSSFAKCFLGLSTGFRTSWQGVERGGLGRVWMAAGRRCLEDNSLGDGAFWVRSGSGVGGPAV